MIADELRAYSDEVVERLLRENEHRWRSLQPADRLLVEALAREVAARLLGGPTRRIVPAHEQALADLFALRQPSSERRTRVSV